MNIICPHSSIASPAMSHRPPQFVDTSISIFSFHRRTDYNQKHLPPYRERESERETTGGERGSDRLNWTFILQARSGNKLISLPGGIRTMVDDQIQAIETKRGLRLQR